MMRFTIQRELFLKHLKAVAGAVEKRQIHVLPILSNVLIDVSDQNTFSLTTTDQEVELVARGNIDHPETIPGRITVPLRKLVDICRALPEGSLLNLTEEQNRIIIRAGRSRFSLSTLPAEQFPAEKESQETQSFSLSNRQLKYLIDSTSFAMAEQDVRYYFNGMLLEMKPSGLFAVTSDGHRLAKCSVQLDNIDPKLKNLRIIIPRKGILELQRILEEDEEMIQIMLGQNQLRVATNHVIFTTRLLEGKFPDYERIIPKTGNNVVIASRHLLKEAFLRAAALFSDKTKGVKLLLGAGGLKILATNTEQDEVEEDLEVEYQGETLEIGFNVKYLLDFINIINEDRVKLTFLDAKSSARVEGVTEETGVYVIMPMRI